jgi:ribosomal protein S18 acetylase RimI-like enzyme
MTPSVTPSVTTRPATPEDDAFLYALFSAVRGPDFAHLPMPPAQLDMLLRIQFAGQKQSYGAQYPGSDSIVLLESQPIGRFWLYHGPTEHQLVDISLLPEFRNRGIGGALVRQAVADAREAGVRLCCSVARTNTGSLKFHQRLGFQIVGEDEVYYDLAVEP